MGSSYFDLRNALFGFGDGNVDHSVFNGLEPIVNGINGLRCLAKQEALVSDKALWVQARKDDVALDEALRRGFSGRIIGGIIPSQGQTNHGFPFVGAVDAAAAIQQDVLVPHEKHVQSGYSTSIFGRATVHASATMTGGAIFMMGGVQITDAYILEAIAFGGANMIVNLDGTPSSLPIVQQQSESKKKSHKANEKLSSITRARSLPSLRINIQPNPPYSPTTAGGRAVAGGGVSKAKTPSPVTPVTAPKL